MSRVEPNRNVYVGHRYVPKIFGEWDQSIDYEGLSIVTHQGTSYTSKKRVPVGIDILNEEYWVVTGNYNAQIEYYRQDVRNMENEVGILKGVSSENTENINVNKDSILNLNGEVDTLKDVSSENTENINLNKNSILNINNEVDTLKDVSSENTGNINLNKDSILNLNDDVKQRSVNVKNHPYNAKGDNIQDDTQSIKNALEDNDIVFLPEGKYYITSTINVPIGKSIIFNPGAELVLKSNIKGLIITDRIRADNIKISIDYEVYTESALTIMSTNNAEPYPYFNGIIGSINITNPARTYKGTGIEFKAINNDGVVWLKINAIVIDGFEKAILFNNDDGWINNNTIDYLQVRRCVYGLYTNDNGLNETSGNTIKSMGVQSSDIMERSIYLGNKSHYNNIEIMTWDWQKNHPDGGYDIELNTGTRSNDIKILSLSQGIVLDKGDNTVESRDDVISKKRFQVERVQVKQGLSSVNTIDDNIYETYITNNNKELNIYFRKNYTSIIGKIMIDENGILQYNDNPVLTGYNGSANIDHNIQPGEFYEVVIPVTGATWGSGVSVGAPYVVPPGIMFNGFVSAENEVTIRFYNAGEIRQLVREVYNVHVIHKN